MDFRIRRRLPTSFFVFSGSAALFYLLILYERDLFLIIFFSIFFLMLRDHVDFFISCYPFRSSKEYNKRFKRVNHQYYGFLCDPKKRSNPSNFRMKFTCTRSQKEVETPQSATIIFKANEGFELYQDDFGRFHFGVSGLSSGYFIYKMLTNRVQVAYFNWNDQVYKAGCTMFLEELGKGKEMDEEDEKMFIKFSNDRKFWNLMEKMKREVAQPKVLEIQESDLKVLYATRDPYFDDFVVFTRNQRTNLIQKFIYNTNSFSFEKVNCGLQYDSKKNISNEKLSLLFMTYDRSGGDVKTLTVYRTANGNLEKKMLNVERGLFEVLPMKPIISREKVVGGEEFREEIEDGFEILNTPEFE